MVIMFYVGVNVEIIQGYIIQLLQQSLVSVEGIDYMILVSWQNYLIIFIYVWIGVNIDCLVIELLVKFNEVKSQLLLDVEDLVLQKEVVDVLVLMYISFYSEQMNNLQIIDYLLWVIQFKLVILFGIVEVEIFGNQVFVMCLWLDLVKMVVFGVIVGEINQVVQQYNFFVVVGEVKGQLVVISVNVFIDFKLFQVFVVILVKIDGDCWVLMGDVVWVELGVVSYDVISLFNGIFLVYIGIKGMFSVNLLDVIKEVWVKMFELEE